MCLLVSNCCEKQMQTRRIEGSNVNPQCKERLGRVKLGAKSVKGGFSLCFCCFREGTLGTVGMFDGHVGIGLGAGCV